MPDWLGSLYYWVVSQFLTHFGFLLALVFLANLLRQRRSPSSTMAWLLVILLLPYVGVPLYVLFGGRKMIPMARSKERIYTLPKHAVRGPYATANEQLLASYGVPAANSGNAVQIVEDGVDTFNRLIELVEAAETTVHITTYILSIDDGTKIWLERLAERAAAGVSVKILIDSVGSWKLRRSALRPLIQAGVEVAFFMPVLAMPFRGRANLRNHRKLVIVDGRIALTGGINLAWPYIAPVADQTLWRDMAVVVEGPAVRDLEAVFDSDWRFATRPSRQLRVAKRAVERSEQPAPAAISPRIDSSRVQVVASGPDVAGDPLYESLLELFFAAQDRIWIITPYFVPDEMLLRSLTLAARRGVDVTLIMPARSNHISADLARASYLRDLNVAGARVLLYTPCMLHAKVTLIDDRLAIIGSANMDMRSLFLNYEVSLLVTSATHVVELAAWASDLMDDSIPDVPAAGGPREIAENVVRLLSPLL